MKSNELRIGNYFGCDGDILQVTNINEHGIFGGKIAIKNTGMRTNSGQKYPIEITKEWLLKLGFKRGCPYSKERGFTFPCDGFFFEKDVNLVLEESAGRIVTEVEFVHQLQNLYFALTGEELKLNEK